MGSELDPITQVYEALWDLLEAHQGFIDMVAPGNRIKMYGQDPLKDQISTADTPEVRIVPAGGAMHIDNSTSSSKLIRRYSIQVATGERDVSAALYPLEFEIFIALHGWTTSLMALEWSGCKFVKRCQQLDLQEGINQFDLNRGIKGWTAVWSCEVEMWFSSTDLAPIPVGSA